METKIVFRYESKLVIKLLSKILLVKCYLASSHVIWDAVCVKSAAII